MLKRHRVVLVELETNELKSIISPATTMSTRSWIQSKPQHWSASHAFSHRSTNLSLPSLLPLYTSFIVGTGKYNNYCSTVLPILQARYISLFFYSTYSELKKNSLYFKKITAVMKRDVPSKQGELYCTVLYCTVDYCPFSSRFCFRWINKSVTAISFFFVVSSLKQKHTHHCRTEECCSFLSSFLIRISLCSFKSDWLKPWKRTSSTCDCCL